MAFQEFELNMIPHGDMPTFYASQYETGRPIIIDIMMGEDAFDCSELYIELHARKVDDNIVTLEPDSVDGNQVTFVGTDQLFACPGKNLCEVCLYADETKDTSLGSLNFFIEVEPDPLSGGLTSETQIHNLYQQVEEITQQVIGDDYYNKTEVDDLLDDKADKSDTYTKSQVDTALNLKADKATTYTKTQTDNFLNDKADKSTTYTKTQVDNALALKANSADLATVATTGDYDDLINKPTIPAAQVQSDWSQADNTKVDYIKNKPDFSVFVTSDALSEIIYDLLPAGTASGATANFDTDLTLPLVDCKAYIVASQASGTPTPSSPLAISGYTGVNLTVCGKNFFSYTFGETLPASGTAIIDFGREITFNGFNIQMVFSGRFVNQGAGFLIGKDGNDNNSFVTSMQTYVDANGNALQANTDYTNKWCCSSTSNTVKIRRIYFYTYPSFTDPKFESVMCEGKQTPSTYTPYNGTTYAVSWQDEAGTVYGGNIDLTTGLLTVTWLGKTYTGDANEHWVMHGSGSASAFAMRSSDYLNIDINELPKADYLQGISRSATWGNFDNWVSVTADKQIVTGIQSITSVTDWTDYLALNPLTVIWKAETPVTYQLTPTQVDALLGVNNVFNDTNGDTEVQYKDSIQHYIDTRV